MDSFTTQLAFNHLAPFCCPLDEHSLFLQVRNTEIISSDSGMDVAFSMYGVMQPLPPQDRVRIIGFPYGLLLANSG